MRKWFASPEPCSAAPEVMHFLLPAQKLGKKSGANQPQFTIPEFELICDPMQWLFLDTETTGITGGTGTYPFLVGVAWWDSAGLQVEQFFMRDFGEEHAVLEELAARMANRRVLVTFNGKSFDWPLLETRYAMTRMIQPCQPVAHLDFLHPARALWKLRLGSVRLVELERRVLDAPRLGWHRGDDIDSALIPQFYFDYLRGGPFEPVAGVFRHNQMDLRGLAALAGKILGALSPKEDSHAAWNALDLVALSRLVHKHGEVKRALRLYEQALGAKLPPEMMSSVRCELAMLAKRGGDCARANALWKKISEDSKDPFHAFEQLAIFYEYTEKDLQRAAEITERALKFLRQTRTSRSAGIGWSGLNPDKANRMGARFEHRLKRLERKATGQLGRRQHLLPDATIPESLSTFPESNRS